jgi:hypothetical protein
MSRTPKEVDWKKVDDYLEGGMTGIEIAAFFDMHHDTFYDKVKEKYNTSFTVYCQSKRSRGDGLLKVKSYQKAMNGDNVQLTLNLKNRCGWSDKLHQTLSNDPDNPVSEWITNANGQSKDLVKDDSQPST